MREISVAEIRPNPYQPRTSFSEAGLAELRDSIAEHGVLQPVVVRPAAVGFELIAGERRLRAVKALGHVAIPAIVRRAADEEMQTLALVENLQRVDLNAIEKARALQAMMRNFGLTQEEVATRVGKARTSISNVVRLLELPSVIQDLVSEDHLSGSQARALLLAHGVERRIALARRAVRQGLTVRQIERLAKAERSGEPVAREPDPYMKDLETRLQQALGTRVELRAKGRGGAITIGYHDAGELDRLLGVLGVN
ncbi:MAG: ParB/RepB/Spo0J family partition protein [Planctomycetota bacterium]|nr:ParB/RepB/Spo0J family partition protein [Planctomycetota bacterium]